MKKKKKKSTNYCMIVLISHSTKVILKVLQAKLQQYVNKDLPDVHSGSRKGRRSRGQIANIRGVIGKAREFQKNVHFCFIDYTKAFDCVVPGSSPGGSRVIQRWADGVSVFGKIHI